ncbi:hypothetical protein DOY81_012976 [Sarcophaga bullata]|nr:hypothetical protein DOY81_012976 [Sarcophaga bullata]
MKQRICAGKKDYTSFVLVGTERTLNDVNESKKGYYNIFQYSDELQMLSWELLMNFYQFVNQTASDEGEWLDALAVAFNMLEERN